MLFLSFVFSLFLFAPVDNCMLINFVELLVTNGTYVEIVIERTELAHGVGVVIEVTAVVSTS